MFKAKHNAIVIIPARGGSKRIPKKNIAQIGNKPMLAYSILRAQETPYLKDKVFVSTEDKDIAKIALKYGAKVIARPIELAADETDTLPVLQHAVESIDNGINFDTIIVLQPTSPFRTVKTIKSSIEKLWNNWGKFDAVFSVTKTKFPPSWTLEIKRNKLEFMFPNDFQKIRNQELENTYWFDGVVYVLKKELVLKSKHYPFSPGRTSFVITGKIESIDIDEPEDLEVARALNKHF